MENATENDVPKKVDKKLFRYSVLNRVFYKL